ncbi:hypothetical protein OsI_08068 [Oryza sativa Indica Group]|uniref:Uncharacterized protein n=1 Tax=Oryza sativa subsp. indica TaxID=39946 RepID=A2X776_ORYSI|nr:hypothetical protein OsI_08068 [Oryza sativa Indica Group]
MANYLKLPIARCLLLLFCSYLPAIVSSHAAHPQQPDSFPNERLYRAYLVIQRFKSTITSDPKNVTASWTGHDICGEKSYLGFYCATPTGRSDDLTVTGIIWNGYGMRAPKLQGFLDQLPDLALFHAASNYFGSDIPRLNAVPYLYNLNVDRDALAHPQAEGKLTGDSRIHTPCINGEIHFIIKVITDLPKKKWGGWGKTPAGATNARALLLNYNSLSGPLPANLGASKLSYLALANNELTGSIPPSIAQAQDSLLEMLLLNNQLSGCLPHELGMLTKAAVIDAGMNQLTGPIPSSFSCLTSVEQLNLGGNRLYGEIPDALCKLAVGPAGRLANLTLSSNYFTSVGPACLSLIKDGVLNVKNNCIPGFTNQRRPAECASFHSQPKTCPAASATHVACPAGAADAAAAPADRVAKDYSSYVTYATLHK